jgi:DNA-binding transcriptional MocR family regulator
MELLAKSYVDPGDVVLVEAPTYLGAIMAFRGYAADVRGVLLDDGGMRVDVLAGRRAAAEDHLYDPRLPESNRPVDERGAPVGVG